MTKTVFSIIVFGALLLSGCGDADMKAKEKKAKPTFMFWCFRQEIVSDDYHVPGMKNEAAAAYIRQNLKREPGYVKSEVDLASNTVTVFYQSSTSRKMNFENVIAKAGFTVNNRPANKNAKLPEGVK
jgi:copper chaperone CopZ